MYNCCHINQRSNVTIIIIVALLRSYFPLWKWWKICGLDSEDVLSMTSHKSGMVSMTSHLILPSWVGRFAAVRCTILKTDWPVILPRSTGSTEFYQKFQPVHRLETWLKRGWQKAILPGSLLLLSNVKLESVIDNT